jgi:hypothetical protein
MQLFAASLRRFLVSTFIYKYSVSSAIPSKQENIKQVLNTEVGILRTLSGMILSERNKQKKRANIPKRDISVW